MFSRAARHGAAGAAIVFSLVLLSGRAAGPRFFPDDPLTTDNVGC
jgi:hypothetical protein